ncbi:MAG: DUF4287 domain-containing protein [Deltaproteobacteria bacterium]|nr:DUF4287 domain-containing protein [Deltaproteobacteria bacterium]
MAKSPEEMAQSMIANLKEKTGKSLPEWLKITTSNDLEKHGQLVKMLKTDHGITHGFANLIAHKTLETRQGGQKEEKDLVASQYSGAKEGLKPIYDALIEIVQGFGKDVEVSPKKTYVSLRRSKQFALIQPSTKTRVDVGLNCKGTPATERLEVSGSFNAMVSHRVRLTEPGQVDDELAAWLRAAYEAS